MQGFMDSIDKIMSKNRQVWTLSKSFRSLGCSIAPTNVLSVRQQVTLLICIYIPLLSPEFSDAKMRIRTME
jgi:hypothetical protein